MNAALLGKPLKRTWSQGLAVTHDRAFGGEPPRDPDAVGHGHGTRGLLIRPMSV